MATRKVEDKFNEACEIANLINIEAKKIFGEIRDGESRKAKQRKIDSLRNKDGDASRIIEGNTERFKE